MISRFTSTATGPSLKPSRSTKPPTERPSGTSVATPLTVISIGGETSIGGVKLPPFVRPSALARFLGIHARTLHAWMRQGRLASIRSPGGHMRLRLPDVRAFCEREGFPIPPFVSPPLRRVVVAGVSESASRAVGRALKTAAIQLEVFDSAYDGIVAASSKPTDLLVMGAPSSHFDAAAAIRAVKAGPTGGATRIVTLGASTRAGAEGHVAAGAVRALLRSGERDLPGVVRELLALGG